MEISVGAKVSSTAGKYGNVTSLLVNPATRQVTHVVVKEHGFLGQERMVPIQFVTESLPDEINLRLAPESLHSMENFDDVSYTGGEDTFDTALVEAYFSHPFVLPEYDAEEEHYYIHIENVPPGELAIHAGAQVYAADGLLGRIAGFLVSAIDDRISHLVMQTGHLRGRRQITVPVTAIDHIAWDGIYLTLDKATAGELPAAPIQHLLMNH